MSLPQDIFRLIFPAPKPSPAPADAQGARNDSWVNSALGYGAGLDKTSQGFFAPTCRLSDSELSDLYYGDAIAAKIVDFIPDELFRRGYCLKSKTSQDRADALQTQLDDLDVDKTLRESIRWSRLFGGGLTVLGTNDGQDLLLPLNPDRSNGLQFLANTDRRFAIVNRFYGQTVNYNGILNAGSGKPEVYQVTAIQGGIVYVHESRAIRFEGIPVDTLKSRELAGWTLSVLQRPYDRLREFMTAYGSSSALLADASQAVFKLKDLWKQVSQGGPTGGRKALQARMALVDMTRSSSRSVLLDADGEGFERAATSFAGIPDLLDRFMMLLSATTGIPVSILMGRAPQGMNATGDADIRMFYDRIATMQDTEITPVITKILDLIGDVPEDLEVDWHPLWEPSDKEKAETELLEEQAEKAKADTYAVYVTMTALLPEQVAIAEFGSGDGQVEIDEAALEKSLAAEIELSLEPPAPVPVDPNAPAAPAGNVPVQ